MKKTPHPDRSREAANLRDELSDQPDAIRSLDALAREESSDDSIPPIPDDLRDQWQDRYGAARQPVPPEKESWLGKVSKLWLYGGATALAALALFVSLRNDPTITPNKPDVTMRGGGAFTPIADTITIYLASDSIPFQSLYVTRQADFTLEAKDLNDAITLLKKEGLKSAVILNGKTGILTPWNGELLEDVALLKVTDSTDEYDLSEALDTFLKQ
ncbi:MAG: hypothetical protein ACJAQT_001473 [Akkermansiaceae bacterium]|jgi:hypothetical protein